MHKLGWNLSAILNLNGKKINMGMENLDIRGRAHEHKSTLPPLPSALTACRPLKSVNTPSIMFVIEPEICVHRISVVTTIEVENVL